MNLPFQIGKELASWTLPYPPSSNALYANRKSHKPGQKGRIKTDKYKLWRDAAGKEILVQGCKHISGQVFVTIEALPPDNRARDIDNLAKATLDCLVWMNVIEDDKSKHVRGVFAYWLSPILYEDAPGITVSIYRVGE